MNAFRLVSICFRCLALLAATSFAARAELQCDVTQITDTLHESDFPVISADGSTLAFISEANLTGENADNSGEIFLYDIFTDTFTQVTDNDNFFNRDLGISGDGSRIVFVARGGPTKAHAGKGAGDDIWLYDADTDTFTPVAQGDGRDLGPDIDAAGERVVFYAESDLTGGNSDGNFEVFLYEVTGANLTQITDTPFVTCCLGGTSISSDGSTIGFEAFADLAGGNADGNQEVFIYDIADQTFTQVSDSTGNNSVRPPALAGDASRVAYTMNDDPFGTNPEENYEIFTYDTKTMATQQLTQAVDGFSFVTPGAVDGDGERIAFDTDGDFIGPNPDDNDELVIHDRTDGTFTRVTDINEDEDVRGVRTDDSGQRIVFFSRASIPTAKGVIVDDSNEIFLAKCNPKSIPALGNYFDLAQPGWGLDIQRAQTFRGDIIFVIWFTYRPDGTPIWYLAVGEIVGNRWDGNADVFSWDGTSATPTAVGTMRLVWTSDTEAEFTWNLNGDPGNATVTFAEFSTDPTVVDYTGHHFPPLQPGWGASALTQGPVTVVTIYFYDGAGDPTWMQGVDFAADLEITPEMRLFDGPGLCPACIARKDQTKGATSEVVLDMNVAYLRRLKNAPDRIDDLRLLFGVNYDTASVNAGTDLGPLPFAAIDLPGIGLSQTLEPLTPVDDALTPGQLGAAVGLDTLNASPTLTPALGPVTCTGNVSTEFTMNLVPQTYGDLLEDGAPVFFEDELDTVWDTAAQIAVFRPGETTAGVVVEGRDTGLDAGHVFIAIGPSAGFFADPAAGLEMDQAVSLRLNNVSGTPEIGFWDYSGAPPSPNCAVAE